MAVRRRSAVMAPVRTEEQGREMLEQATHPEPAAPAAAPKVLTAWQMDVALKERARAYAKAEGHTLTWTLDRALREYLERHGC